MRQTNRSGRGASHWPFPALTLQAILIVGIILVAGILFPFWGSLLVASVFAFGLYPYVKKLSARVKSKKRVWLVGGAVFALALVLMLPASLFSLRLYNLATSPKEGDAKGMFSTETLNKASDAKEKVEATIIRYGVKAHMFRNEAEAEEAVRSGSKSAMTAVFGGISSVLVSVPEIFLTFLVFCLFLFLFLAKAQQIRSYMIKTGVMSERDIDCVTEVMQSSCYNSLISNLLIGVIQAAIIAVGARFAGYNETVMIFTLVFALSFIPFIGSAPVAYLLAALSLITGNSGNAILMAVIGTVAGTIDNVIRPYLIANGENEVHPIFSFAAIIGAIGILGFKGLFLGPVILTATIGILNIPGRRDIGHSKAA